MQPCWDRSPAAALLLLLLAPGVAPPPVTVDYDRHADFDRYATYRWVLPRESEEDPLTDQRLINAIDYHLSLAGLRQVRTGESDLLVTYHSDSSGEVVVDSREFGYRFGPGWYWGGGPVSTAAPVHRYPRGTLVIDLWDARDALLVWRGSAPGTVEPTPPPYDAALHRAAEALFADFPPGSRRAPGDGGER